MALKEIVQCPDCGQKMRVPADKHVRFSCSNCGLELENVPATFEEVDEKEDEFSFGDMILNILTYLSIFPLFIILHRLVPDVNWPIHLDRILLAIGAFVLIRIVLEVFRTFAIIAFVLAFGYLVYGSFWGDYGFRMAYTEYRAMISALKNEPVKEKLPQEGLVTFPYPDEFNYAINANDGQVRNYALGLTRKYFSKQAELYSPYRTQIQCFAIFKEINSNWNYVSDPASREYFATAAESIQHLSGDCDDHSILMASCLQRVGGEVRLILTNGHIYPEFLIGSRSDFEKVMWIIQTELFPESRGKAFHYHRDKDGNYWMNLDYTETYPGGPFLDEEVLSIFYPEQP